MTSLEPTSTKFNILLVEDSDADTYLLRRAMKQAGMDFDLKVINNGSDALDFVSNPAKYSAMAPIDLAVLDINLPGEGGIEILEALRHNPDLKRVPVAVMTSSESPVEKAKTEKIGVDQFILKPPDLKGLADVVLKLKNLLLENNGKQH